MNDKGGLKDKDFKGAMKLQIDLEYKIKYKYNEEMKYIKTQIRLLEIENTLSIN